MKKRAIVILITVVLMAGCQPVATTETEIRPTNTTISSTQPSSMLTATGVSTETDTPSPVATETVIPTSTHIYPADTQLASQCLTVAEELSDSMASAGVIVLANRELAENGRSKPGIQLIDMSAGSAVSLDALTGTLIVSPDKRQMAYLSSTVDEADNVVAQELVVADSTGEVQENIPWEENWNNFLGWTADNRLLIEYREADWDLSIPSWHLVLDPVIGEEQLLRPEFPNYIQNVVPHWDGWGGVVYDPTLTRAIYPRMLEDDELQFAYALWDLISMDLVTSLENIWPNEAFSDVIEGSDTPQWADDGTQFAYVGLTVGPAYELFQVNRDGEIDQLTNLSEVAGLQGATFSWSPDKENIALILNIWTGTPQDDPTVVVLNTQTQRVIDLCIPIRGLIKSTPIWSPEGSQFLIVDRYEDNHQRVILVDIFEGFAAQIAEDAEPMGWMVAP